MYLFDLQGHPQLESFPELLDTVSEVCNQIYEEMTREESLWIFAPAKSGSEYLPIGMAAADIVKNQSPFVLKNVISRYHGGSDDRRGSDIVDSYEEILFFVKDKRKYYFNKDPIRVEHVYEGNEWNERDEGRSSYHDSTVRRYNPKGKDPGNVWLTEIRTETSDETVDRIEPFPRKEAIQRCILAGSKENELVTLINFGEKTTSLVEKLDRGVCTVSVEVLLGNENDV